jgi:hypothetical protein
MGWAASSRVQPDRKSGIRSRSRLGGVERPFGVPVDCQAPDQRARFAGDAPDFLQLISGGSRWPCCNARSARLRAAAALARWCAGLNEGLARPFVAEIRPFDRTRFVFAITMGLVSVTALRMMSLAVKNRASDRSKNAMTIRIRRLRSLDNLTRDQFSKDHLEIDSTCH